MLPQADLLLLRCTVRSAYTPGPSHLNVTADTFDRQAFPSLFLLEGITTSLENWM